MFPNPFHDWIKLEFISNNGIPIQLSISDANGNMLLSQNEKNVNLGQNTFWIKTANLIPGSYFLTIQQGKSKQIKKLSKI